MQTEALQRLSRRLARKLAETMAKEAVENMPEVYRELSDLLDAEAEAIRILKLARQETELHFQKIHQDRTDVQQCALTGGPRFELQPADPELLSQFIKVRGITPAQNGGWGQPGRNIEQVAGHLGLQTPRPGRKATPITNY